MKKLGIILSLCIHIGYSVVSGLMVFGFWESMENGDLLQSIPEGSGMIGLLFFVLMGGMLVSLLLFFFVSLVAVLFEVCDLIFDKRGFAFVYGMISFGFFLFVGSMALSTGMELIGTQGLLALVSTEMAVLGAITLTTLIPTVVGALRMMKK